MLRPSDDQPAWISNIGDVQWDALLLFDAACKRPTLTVMQINVKDLVPFDIIKMGMLWQQLQALRHGFERWLQEMFNDTDLSDKKV
jgi:hypothetical protein